MVPGTQLMLLLQFQLLALGKTFQTSKNNDIIITYNGSGYEYGCRNGSYHYACSTRSTNASCIIDKKKTVMMKPQQHLEMLSTSISTCQLSTTSITETISIPAETQTVKDLGNGYLSRSLIPQDAEYVNSIWPYSSSDSVLKIRTLITNNPKYCLGIIEKSSNNLVGCILQYQNGALGMLHVDSNHRRCGLGEYLLTQVTKQLKEDCLPCFAFIMDNNIASESLFRKQGWVREDPNVKRGTGRRRAKRKWIKLY